MATTRFCIRWLGKRDWLTESGTWTWSVQRRHAREFDTRRQARHYSCKYPEGSVEVVKVVYPCGPEQYGDAQVLRRTAHLVATSFVQTTEGKRAARRAAAGLRRAARALTGRARLFVRRRPAAA